MIDTYNIYPILIYISVIGYAFIYNMFSSTNNLISNTDYSLKIKELILFIYPY